MASLAAMAKMPILSVGNAKHRLARGFTLLEVLVVLVILGLAMTLVVPVIGRSMQSSMSDVARNLELEMRRARSEAVTQQRNTLFWVDVVSRGYGTGHRELGEIPALYSISARTADLANADSRAGLLFFPDGSSSGGSVTLRHGGEALTLEVDWLTGRVVSREAGVKP